MVRVLLARAVLGGVGRRNGAGSVVSRRAGGVFTGGVSRADGPIVCATCGDGAAEDEPVQARSTRARAVEDGRAVWTRDRCSREHLRSIERKLDAVWW